MQIIVLGLHKQNVPDEIWRRAPYEIEPFYRFVSPLNHREPNSEFLFVNASYSREILAVVEDIDGVKQRLNQFFRSFFRLSPKEVLRYHHLVGAGAVSHFLQLSLGLESADGTRKQEFLQHTAESIELANKLNLAGPIINRIYHGALILRGKSKKNGILPDQNRLGVQIKELAKKIFGQIAPLNLLVVGQNERNFSLILNHFSESISNVQVYSTNTAFSAPGFNAEQHFSEESRIEEKLLHAHVVFRLNQDGDHFFQVEPLTKLMHRRKNHPLLIINLDSTISSKSSLNRIYNLYNYDFSDFLNMGLPADNESNLQQLIENELKEFFSWFYSKQYHRFGNIVSKSPAMEHVLEMIARVSQTDITVLIQGESGTGKELIARAIHENSPRRARPFIVVNCGALTETLLESELFGHEKGAFTGATHTKKGLFEEAHRGSIFLDEIGDTSPALQVKLLRVLQEGEIKRVGSSETLHIDVRLIAATHQNLDELVAQNRFRRDLYYRLNVVNLSLPPLRHRKEDILPLAEYFMGKYSDKMKKRVVNFTERARQALLAYHWPGNVRELENAIERAVALAIGNVIHTSDLPEWVQKLGGPGSVREKIERQMTLKEIEKEVILANLVAHEWNYDRVAEILDIGRTTLWRKMKEYGIRRNG